MLGNHLLEIKNLKIDVRVTKKRRLSIVDTASLIIEPGEIIGLIGEPTPPVIGRGGAQNKNS